MKYLEITKTSPRFTEINLETILVNLRFVAQVYSWSLQLIDAVGEVRGVVGMDMVDLEKYCNSSEHGLILDLEKLIKLVIACNDIEDIVIVACKNGKEIPKAYKQNNWEELCDVIISKEDSSLWQFFSVNDEVMDYFCSLAKNEKRAIH